VLNFLKRKKKDEKVEEKEIEEEVERDVSKVEESDELTKVMERLNEVENRLPRMDVSIEGLRREIDDVKAQLKRMEDTLKDVMVLYEVVSSQINPFLSSSGGIIDTGKMKRSLELLEKDLKIILGVDLDKILDEVLYGGNGFE